MRTERAREFLSTLGFWVVVAYFGLAAVVVAVLVLFGRTAREEALRTASARSAASTQVGQCFTAAKNAPVTIGFIDAHEAVIDNGIQANRAALNLRPQGRLAQVEKQSLIRLEDAKANADALRRLILRTTPTIDKCVDLAKRLEVDASRYTRRKP